MLTDNELYARIDRAIDRAYVGFMLMLIGADLTRSDYREQLDEANRTYRRRALLDVLYVLLRNRPADGYLVNAKLGELIASAEHKMLPVLNDAQQATLDIAQAAMLDAIETTKQEIKKQVRQKLVEANREHRQLVAVKRIESVEQVKTRKDDLKVEVLALIPLILLAARETFERSFSSALTDTINDVVVDSATADSLFTGVPPKDVIVYKKTVDDASRCTWCRKFYVKSDGSPILYTLAQLQANGSNYGKPKSEWRPVLGKTHPRCRCQLFHRPTR